MTDDHPTPELLDRLLAGASTGEESSRILAHLVGSCETCSRYVRGALARAGRPQRGPEAYDQVFAGSLTRSSSGIAGIHADQLEAAALWATIEGTPGPLRGKLIARAIMILTHHGFPARLLPWTPQTPLPPVSWKPSTSSPTQTPA